MSPNASVSSTNCTQFQEGNDSAATSLFAYMYDYGKALNTTPCDWNGASEDSPMPLTMPGAQFSHELLEILTLYFVPPVIVIGIVLNIAICFLLLNRPLKKEGSSHFLSATSLADAAFLLCLLTVWISILGVDVYNRRGLCQLMSFINNLSAFLPLWYVVLFAVDRAIVHYSRTSHKKRSSPLQAKICIIGALVIGVVIHINSSLTMGVVDFPGIEKCIVLPRFIPYLAWFSLMDSLVNIVIPYSIIAGALIITVRSACMPERRQHTATVESCPLDQNAPVGAQYCRLTTTTIWLLATFLLTRLPSEAFRLINVARNFSDDLVMPPDPTEYFCQQLAQNLFFLSHALKPLVYVFLHEGVRKTSWRRGLRRRSRVTSSTMMAMSSTDHVVSIEESKPLNGKTEITPV